MSAETNATECTQCATAQFLLMDQNSGDCVCSQCGQVAEIRYVDRGQEWRDFSDGVPTKDNKARASRANCISDQFTQLGAGAPRGMQMAHTAVQGLCEPRSLRLAHTKILALSTLVRVDQEVSSKCYELIAEYRKCAKTATRGESLVAALYLACRIERVPRTVADLVTACSSRIPNLTAKTVRKHVIAIQSHLNLANFDMTEPMTYLSPEEFVTMFINRLDIVDKMAVEKTALVIISECQSSLSYRPSMLAGIAVVCAARFELGKVDIADVAKELDLNEPTLRRGAVRVAMSYGGDFRGVWDNRKNASTNIMYPIADNDADNP